MASLQARHQRDCSIVRARRDEKRFHGSPGSADQWSTFAAATKRAGCSCSPLYYVVHRHDGRLVREPVGHSRKEAERALDARRGDIARRTYRVIEDIAFGEWADRWLAGHTGKANTKRVYQDTLDYAKRVFGAKKVRDLGTGDVRRFLDAIRDETRARRERHRKPEDPPVAEVAPATLSKHLRTLGACLQASIAEGFASENPVRLLHKTARPRVAKSKPSYFSDVELARLWPELAERPLMLAFHKTAVATGLRLGELASLRWTDVDLLARELHVRRTYVDGIGEQTPKSGDARVVDLTPPAAKVLEDWFQFSGGGDGLVFEREEGGHITSAYCTKAVLYPAMSRANVDRIGESGRKRTFHSLRHSFARIALEAGAEITWVKEALGHSTIVLTIDLYGAWSRASRKAQAERLADAFVL